MIALEDLDIQEMINKSHKHRRRNIYKNCFNVFKTRLVQKSERFSGKVVFVNKYFPSSQLCSVCDKKHEMPIEKRKMMCNCGLEINRDLNAAINILNEGRRTLLVG